MSPGRPEQVTSRIEKKKEKKMLSRRELNPGLERSLLFLLIETLDKLTY